MMYQLIAGVLLVTKYAHCVYACVYVCARALYTRIQMLVRILNIYKKITRTYVYVCVICASLSQHFKLLHHI